MKPREEGLECNIRNLHPNRGVGGPAECEMGLLEKKRRVEEVGGGNGTRANMAYFSDKTEKA